MSLVWALPWRDWLSTGDGGVERPLHIPPVGMYRLPCRYPLGVSLTQGELLPCPLLSTHRQTYGVAGMTCGHCVAAVTQEVGAIAALVA